MARLNIKKGLIQLKDILLKAVGECHVSDKCKNLETWGLSLDLEGVVSQHKWSSGRVMLALIGLAQEVDSSENVVWPLEKETLKIVSRTVSALEAAPQCFYTKNQIIPYPINNVECLFIYFIFPFCFLTNKKFSLTVHARGLGIPWWNYIACD